MNYGRLCQLASAAYPRNDADWGTERQIDAENAFFRALEAEGVISVDDMSEESIAFKMTTVDAINQGLTYALEKMEGRR